MFTVVLQAGLSALKTPLCYKSDENKNTDCPVCSPALNVIAASLPYAHCAQSRLVCNISGQPLNENNHPLMLPNGYIYGEQVCLRAKLYFYVVLLCIPFLLFLLQGIWYLWHPIHIL